MHRIQMVDYFFSGMQCINLRVLYQNYVTRPVACKKLYIPVGAMYTTDNISG